MNALDDLRRTLDAHAADADLVNGGDLGGRTASIHRRVHRVKRRRQAAVAGAAAAVVAVVGGVALLPGGADRAGIAPATVLGTDVPTELTAVGFGYELAEVVESEEGRASVRLGRSDEPRLVSWTDPGGAGTVRVSTSDNTEPEVRASGFGDWLQVDPGRPLTVRVTAGGGPAALAVYTLADERPAGVTGAGTTYREQIAGGTLIDAVIGEPGQGDLTLEATAAGRGTRIYVNCTGLADDGLVMHYETVGDGDDSYGTEDCSQPLPVDATLSGAVGLRSEPGQDVTTRVWLTRGEDGPVVDDPSVRLTAAAYALDENPVRGESFEPVMEYAGHTWRLADQRVRRGASEVALTAPEGEGTVLAQSLVASRSDARVEVDLGADPGPGPGAVPVTGGSRTGMGSIVPPGSTSSLVVRSGEVADVTLELALYVQAD